MNEAVEADGAGRQATVRWQYFFLEFMAGRAKIFGKDVDGFAKRDQRGEELSRFMRMFIKTEHGPEAPTPAHPFDLPPCKLNTPVYLLGHFSQSARQGFVVGVISLDSPTAAEKAKFICLFIFCLRLCCAQLLAGHEKEKTTHCIFIYGYPPSTHYPHIHHVYICAI